MTDPSSWLLQQDGHRGELHHASEDLTIAPGTGPGIYFIKFINNYHVRNDHVQFININDNDVRNDHVQFININDNMQWAPKIAKLVYNYNN